MLIWPSQTNRHTQTPTFFSLDLPCSRGCKRWLSDVREPVNQERKLTLIVRVGFFLFVSLVHKNKRNARLRGNLSPYERIDFSKDSHWWFRDTSKSNSSNFSPSESIRSQHLHLCYYVYKSEYGNEDILERNAKKQKTRNLQNIFHYLWRQK